MTRTEHLPDMPVVAAWSPGVVYGLALLATGWILGPLRTLMVAPFVGPVVAVFFEAPLMIGVMVLTVRWIDRRGWLGRRRRDRAATGLIGASIVLLGEGAGALLMAGGREGLSTFVTPTGLMGLALLSVAALAPLVLGARPDSRLR